MSSADEARQNHHHVTTSLDHHVSTCLDFDEMDTPLLGTDEAKATYTHVQFDEVRAIWLGTDEAKAALFIYSISLLITYVEISL